MKNLLFLFLLLPMLQYAQIENEVHPPDYIKTITFKGNTAESQLPVLKLGEYVVLEFDALNGDEDDYYYTIEHYNFDWSPSMLSKNEYLDGFDNQRIRNYTNSFNSYQTYSHYKLTVPNQFTKRLKVSGNYMIKIFNDYDELVFSRKFMIYEPITNVGVQIRRSRDVSFIDQKQSVDISISSNAFQFVNPLQTVRTAIVQNNNLNTAITNLKPQYTLGNELIYRYIKEASFWGGNEYFYFENKDVRAANTGIEFIDLKDLYHNYLFVNFPRVTKPYTFNPDINGNFLVTAIDVNDVSIEADYVWMHFALLKKFNPDENVYVYGNFNNYVLTSENLMTFNKEEGFYEAKILLKQGFYSYKYVMVNKDNTLNEGAISGNFWQTENNYKVLVYYRDLGARFDRIIGFGEANSQNIIN